MEALEVLKIQLFLLNMKHHNLMKHSQRLLMHPKTLSTKNLKLGDEGARGIEKLAVSLDYETPRFDEKFTKVDAFENIVNKEKLNLGEGGA